VGRATGTAAARDAAIIARRARAEGRRGSAPSRPFRQQQPLMSCSRRDVVKGALVGGAAAASGLVVIGCGNDVALAPVVPFTTPVIGGLVTLNPLRFLDLAPIGGAITVPLAREQPSQPAALLLIHRGSADDPPEYVAVNSECPHAACPLGYSARQRLIECPCHGSRFLAAPDPDAPGSRAGDVIHRPARSAVAAYDAKMQADALVISLACGAFSVTLTFADHPELMAAGGSVSLSPPTVPCALVVSRIDDTTVVAVDATCTHQACTVAYDAAQGKLVCPCHGSRFGLDGGVEVGPASQPLSQYIVVVDANGVTVSST
jgi:Rieske Fe-S protein